MASDLRDLARVRRHASLSNDGDREMLLANPQYLEFEGEGLAAGRTRVATVDDRIVGFSTVLEADAGGMVEVEDLFVDPEWMRRGIGLELMRDVEARARVAGARSIEVSANPHAMAFYARAGFIEIGEAIVEVGHGKRLRIDL